MSYGHLKVLKEDVYEQVRLSLIEKKPKKKKTVEKVSDSSDVTNVEEVKEETPKIRYNYVGYLEIPRISLKRGFLSKEDRYNNIQYNIKVSNAGSYPDQPNTNFILIAHSGDAYISYFAYLYRLNIGDMAYVTYNGVRYSYTLVKVEVQPKVGVVTIHRPREDVNGLTLITCTKDSDTTQSIYIFERV